MEAYALTYDQMDYKDPVTKKVILEILHHVRNETSVDLSQGRLFIEAFPHVEGGCVLYISTVGGENTTAAKPKRYRNSFNTPLIFRFDTLDRLTDICDKLFKQYSHLVLKSSLYLLDGKYVLLIYSYFKLDNKIIALAKEYGSLIGKGSIKGAFVKEHAKPVIEDTALETIVEYLC